MGLSLLSRYRLLMEHMEQCFRPCVFLGQDMQESFLSRFRFRSFIQRLLTDTSVPP